ncbi:energy-coupling factor transporter ATPase [Miniphocaeibacter halophilus]|uniref:Energy-coupling factor transporter ATPase n=1 Tax=Miniphocaeibacter halophilus TaxID=2931922 RepID=A0AC61MRJ0_9FIRM|nr:energy-coupling factor transporter ATPase [Miniphocaeibacter halophilus]QQK07185.1 energy-coupling factor transporter ATPase [Miniphocaeibacter halophilus]
MQIEIKNLSYVYNEENPFSKVAIDNISLNIGDREFIGIIGHTGSGKSTLVQHLNALITPTSGKIYIDGVDTEEKSKSKIDIRKKVGLVFQYPEYQLFEETVYKDIAFGPSNIGCSEEEIEERVKWACDLVRLDYENIKDKSPFELSGGQKRRVAIAGVLAMKPQCLVLDEPTAGLDPRGRDEILDEIRYLYDTENISIILVSHSMEDVARLVNRIIVMDKGKIFMDGTPKEIFAKPDKLTSVGLDVPQVTEFMLKLKEKGLDIPTDIITIEEAYEVLSKYLKEKNYD